LSLCKDICLLARHLHKTFNTLGVSHPVPHYSYIRARLVWRRRKHDKTTEGCLQHWPFLKRSRRDVSSLDCQCYGGWRLDCRHVVTLPLSWWDIILQPTPCWRWSVDASVHDYLHERDLVALTRKPERTTSYHYLWARVAIGNDYVGWSSLMSVSTPPVLWDGVTARWGAAPHSEHRFPAPSSKLCQIWLRHSISPRSCPATRSAPSGRFRY